MQKRRTVMAKYKSLIVTTLLSVAALTGAVTKGGREKQKYGVLL